MVIDGQLLWTLAYPFTRRQAQVHRPLRAFPLSIDVEAVDFDYPAHPFDNFRISPLSAALFSVYIQLYSRSLISHPLSHYLIVFPLFSCYRYGCYSLLPLPSYLYLPPDQPSLQMISKCNVLLRPFIYSLLSAHYIHISTIFW